jgi:hypothetical protein
MTAALAWIILLLQPARLVSAPRAPEAVVQAMFAAFNRHDAAAMEQMYAEDAR